ncbi:MAG: ABC transporter ATP-binding protein [Peptococcaceae bacterium]|nr:MAG: ABC transporter ATP-binding protein [Peptococcaceae bacterium]
MLKVENLESGYGMMQVLWAACLEAKRNMITTVLGPNGAGKTTLLQTIMGIVPPWKGKITCAGEEITKLAPHFKVEKGLTMVLEGRRLFPNMTVRDNLRMGAYTDRAMKKAGDSLVLVYSLFPVLQERAGQKAGTLSGGEQQMLAIARALMTNPDLILLDEPSQGLAPKLITEVFRTIARLKEQGLTILLVEQNVYASLEISDYACVLEKGKVILEGPVEKIKNAAEIKRTYLGL